MHTRKYAGTKHNTLFSQQVIRQSALALLLSLGCGGAAFAQIAPNQMNSIRSSEPSSVQPDRALDRFGQSTIQVPEAPPSLPTLPTPQTPVAGRLAERFTLTSVQVDDMTVYPVGTFDSAFKAKLGKTIYLADAREMARAITARYRTDGYVLSQAVIPNQDLTSGVLHIRVVEGFVDNVIVQNERPQSDRRGLIQQYADKIRAQHPLNTRTLERYMLLIDDLPGVTARAIIKPSPTTFGAADVIVQVKDKVVEGSFTSDNRGNKFLGPYQEQLTLTENSAAGIDERTTIRGINTIPTRDLHFFDIQHEEQLDSEGTKLIGLAAFAQTHPGDSLSDLNLSGRSDDFSLTVTHPFIRSRSENLNGRITFDARNSESDALGIQLNNDRVRAFRLGGTYETGDAMGGVNLADLSVSQGVSWLGASEAGPDRSRTDARPGFTKENLDLSRVQSLPYGFSLLTAATGQYADEPLFVSEQMALGGVGYGQAYDSGEISGDSGVAGKIELRYGQEAGWRWFDSYQLYGYYDIGTVFLNSVGPGVQDQFSLASVGTGVRANFTDNLYGYLEVGFPLTRTVASEDNRDPRLFFSVTARF